MPLLEETKKEMYRTLLDCTSPIFRDKNIIILMILITMFQLDSNPSINHLQTFYFNILRAYVEEHTKNDVHYDLKNISNCILALPRLQKLMGGILLE